MKKKLVKREVMERRIKVRMQNSSDEEEDESNEGSDEDKEYTESSTEESDDVDDKKMPAVSPALPPAVSPALPPAIPPVITVQRKGACCCGCGQDASQRNHYCIYTKKRVMVWCYHPDQEIPEGHRSKAWCKGCYNQLEEKDKAGTLIEILLMESKEHDKRHEEFQALKEYYLNRCCCGCETMASHSEHLCLHSGRKVMPGCFHESTGVDDGIPRAFLCKGCYDKVAPEDGTPK